MKGGALAPRPERNPPKPHPSGICIECQPFLSIAPDSIIWLYQVVYSPEGPLSGLPYLIDSFLSPVTCLQTLRRFTSDMNNLKGKQMSKLTGKVAVVTGGSKGIGAAIARSLAAEGASVVVNYASSKAGADAVVAAIIAAGGKAIAVGGDVSKAAEAKGLIDAAVKNFGRLDILVNNSGVYEFLPIEAITEAHYHKIFNINVLGL